MKQFTKELIKQKFIELLNKKPLSKVTVTSIVEASEINRNTFYYHYADIYAVLTEIFDKELQKVVDVYNEKHIWEESFKLAVQFCLDNKVAVYHIYNSLRREDLERFIFNISGNLMSGLVLDKCRGKTIDEDDFGIIVSFFQNALTQIVITWIAAGMVKDPYFIIDRVGRLFDGSIEVAIERSMADHQ